MIEIKAMTAHDAMVIQRQASQRVQLGIERVMTRDEAEALAAGPGEAWTVREGRRIVACLGLKETFEGRQAVAWAILADGLGGAHLAITRFARERIQASGLRRIEAIVRESVPAEAAWAQLVGLEVTAVLRCFGASSETHLLCERVRDQAEGEG